MATGNITLPDELLPPLEKLARAENRTADDIATEAVRQHLARRFWDKTRREAEQRRGNLSDAQADEIVNRAIQEARKESHQS